MSEFKPITTQEEFESRLSERLEQKGRSVTKQFEGYTSPTDLEKIKKDFQTQITTLNGQLENAQNEVSKKFEGYMSPAELETLKREYEEKIAKYETDSVKTRIAIETGLPLELKERLRGTTEDEIREDAKMLCQFATSKRVAPLGTSEIEGGGNDKHLKKLLSSLNLEKE